jgi:hypothetical protein
VKVPLERILRLEHDRGQNFVGGRRDVAGGVHRAFSDSDSRVAPGSVNRHYQVSVSHSGEGFPSPDVDGEGL